MCSLADQPTLVEEEIIQPKRNFVGQQGSHSNNTKISKICVGQLRDYITNTSFTSILFTWREAQIFLYKGFQGFKISSC